MKPGNIIIGIVLIIALAWMIRHTWEVHQRTKRDAQYQTALHTYTDEIKPGMARSDVEEILRRRNTSFQQVKLAGDGLEDLITIGREDPTGFCIWNDVDVRIHFNSSYDKSDAKGLPADKVEYVNIFEWPRDCL
jgi:hypothetical protein